jgi:hypothetical protein
VVFVKLVSYESSVFMSEIKHSYKTACQIEFTHFYSSTKDTVSFFYREYRNQVTILEAELKILLDKKP